MNHLDEVIFQHRAASNPLADRTSPSPYMRQDSNYYADR